MVKLRNVKLAEKFVFRDEPGVYKRVSSNKARCVFGPPGVVNVEVGIDPESEVFVVGHQRSRSEGGKSEQVVVSPADPKVNPAGTVTVIFEGDDDEEILTKTVSADEALLMSRVDVVQVRTGPRKRELFVIGDIGLDTETGSLHLEVVSRSPAPPKKKKEKTNETGRTTGPAVGNA